MDAPAGRGVSCEAPGVNRFMNTTHNLRRFSLTFILMHIVGCGPSETEKWQAPSSVQSPDYTTPERALKQAQAKWQKGRYSEVVSLLWPIVQAHPKRPAIRLLMGQAYLKGSRPRRALEEGQAVVALKPEWPEAWWLVVHANLRLDRQAEAESALHTLLKVAPKSEQALLELIRLESLRKDFAARDQTVARLIALKPDVMSYRLEHAKSQLSRGKLTEAEKTLKAAIAVNPYDGALHHALGSLYFDTDRLEAAMDEASIALRLKADDEKALMLFRAAFYVAVASELKCRFGDDPWKKEQVSEVLKRFKKAGVKGVGFFDEVHESFGDKLAVKTRIRRVAKRCMKSLPPTSP